MQAHGAIWVWDNFVPQIAGFQLKIADIST